MTTLDSVKDRATITVEEAGELLGLSRGAAYRAANSGQIPVLRLGRRLVVSVPALLTMLSAQDAA